MMQQYYSVVKNPSAVWVNRLMIQPRIDSQYYRTDFVENEYKIEQIGCEKLGEIIERGDYGVLPDSEDYCEKGVPLIRGTNLRDLTIDDKEVIRVPKDYLTSKSEIQHRDILILIKGATIDAEWSVAIVPNIRESMIYNGSIFRVRVKTGYDPYYITAFMSTKYFLLQKTRAISNTGIYYNDKNSLENFMIAIPSPEIQKYIGDKVRRAEELREEAKRLKEETEDLIINKLGTINLEENRNYSSAFISSGKIVERIDSEYYHLKYLKIEDELNRKGYKVKKLGEVCTRIFNGRTYSTTDKERKYCNVGVGELGDWFVNKSKEKFINEKVDKKYCLKANSIIWGNAAHLAKYIGEKVNIVLEEETVIPTTEVTAIEPNEEAIDPYYLFIFMRTQWGYYQIQRTVKGMTAHSYPQDISNILVPIIDLTNEELEVLKNNVITSYKNELNAKQLIQQAKQDVEDLIEGNFDMSKLDNNYTAESRC